MKILIHSKHLEVTADQKKYIEEKIKKLTTFAERIKDEASEIRVEIDRSVGRSNQSMFKIEVTMYIPKSIIRAECVSESVEGAVDEIEEKLKKQIQRYKDKYLHFGKRGKDQEVFEVPEEGHMVTPQDESDFTIPKIIRRKRYKDLTPMTEQDAITKMELIGHTFLLFFNADTDRYSLLYKRKDGFYGIVEPRKEEDLQ